MAPEHAELLMSQFLTSRRTEREQEAHELRQRLAESQRESKQQSTSPDRGSPSPGPGKHLFESSISDAALAVAAAAAADLHQRLVYTLHPAPYTLHPTPGPPPTCTSDWYTPYTLHPAPYTLHPARRRPAPAIGIHTHGQRHTRDKYTSAHTQLHCHARLQVEW